MAEGTILVVIVYLFLLIIIVTGLKICVNYDYLSRSSTDSIKGIFVIIVFFSHCSSYVSQDPGLYSVLFRLITIWIGQLMVVMFFFYSGYGIAHKIISTDGRYVDSFLKHRLLPTWSHFAVCVTLYLILNVFLGTLNEYSLTDIVLSYTGWTSIGNSNWFMFVTFSLYLFVLFSFKVFKGRSIYGFICISVLAILLTILLFFVKKSYWWNTLLCFPLGMWYRYLQERIERVFLVEHYGVLLFFTSLIFGILWFADYTIDLIVGYILLAMSFAVFVVTLSMRVSVGNKVLRFFGNHVFSIYILQRIPMILFKDYIENQYIFLIVCFFVTILISWVFDALLRKCESFSRA